MLCFITSFQHICMVLCFLILALRTSLLRSDTGQCSLAGWKLWVVGTVRASCRRKQCNLYHYATFPKQSAGQKMSHESQKVFGPRVIQSCQNRGRMETSWEYRKIVPLSDHVDGWTWTYGVIRFLCTSFTVLHGHFVLQWDQESESQIA